MHELVYLARDEDDLLAVHQDVAEYRAVISEMQEIRGKMYTPPASRVLHSAIALGRCARGSSGGVGVGGAMSRRASRQDILTVPGAG